jgi:hypothetical protein
MGPIGTAPPAVSLTVTVSVMVTGGDVFHLVFVQAQNNPIAGSRMQSQDRMMIGC